MRGTVVTINADGTVNEQTLERIPTLQELSKAVGGYIEIVPYFERWRGQPCVAFCNEEGKLNRLPINHLAHLAWEQSVGRSISEDTLVGNVVICYGDREFMRAL